MACRKAAYRAMTELSEFMEAQQQEADAKQASLEAEQRRVWTPSAIFEQCCSQWLAYGPEISVHNNRGGGISNSSQGCSGVCGNAHPKITLDYSDGATAVLSHPLDPFLRYFDDLCQQGLASKTETNKEDGKPSTGSTTSSSLYSYALSGFLDDHVTKLQQQQSMFGSHLVKVSSGALAASRRAKDQFLEQQELEREAKRRKTQGPAATTNLLDSVLQICYESGNLLEHLDVAEISWMRLCGNQTMAKFAARMATHRLHKQMKLSYSVLINGRHTRVHEGHCTQDEVPDRLCKTGSQGPRFATWAVAYHVLDTRMPLVMQQPQPQSQQPDNNGTSTSATTKQSTATTFVPKQTQEFEWQAPTFDGLHTSPGGNTQDVPESFRGYLIRVFLEPPDDPKLPETNCLFSTSGPLEVARVRVHSEMLQQEGIHTKEKLVYRIVSNNSNNCTSTATCEPGSTGTISTAPPAAAPVATESAKPTTAQNNHNTLSVQSIQFTFTDLLGIYVRKKLPMAKRKFQEMKQQRPATRCEKEYVKGLAKAARDAPGRAAAFQGMRGW
ncbi:expressed unknown protein [Seminavis robusta]|uniref:Uncharacterized protein n=1 Tax=Seminavis robusta TaxID=568900 RepID=A0A9N8EJW4_9STRA|nr:expressed unknown protein [Seminavis robusta]|eukprot:Sro1103_g241690.1 n/a (555) ;mRNA; r:14797-16461